MRNLALTEVCCGCCPLAPSPELRRKLMLPGAFRRVRLPGPPRLVVMPLPSAETLAAAPVTSWRTKGCELARSFFSNSGESASEFLYRARVLGQG